MKAHATVSKELSGDLGFDLDPDPKGRSELQIMLSTKNLNF